MIRQQQYVLSFVFLDPPHEHICRFRELCEDGEPVKALSFLQGQVSAVVDHDDDNESAVFRSLLSHLLSQSRRTAEGSTPHQRVVGSSHSTTSSGSSPTALHSYTDIEDPLEQIGDGQRALTGSRFRQRTEVYQELLKFLPEGEKEPTGSLLELIGYDLGVGVDL